MLITSSSIWTSGAESISCTLLKFNILTIIIFYLNVCKPMIVTKKLPKPFNYVQTMIKSKQKDSF